MNLENLFVLAYAPTSNSLENEADSSAINLEELRCNLKQIQRLSKVAFEEFSIALDDVGDADKSSSSAAVLRCLSMFFERFKCIITNTNTKTEGLLRTGYSPYSDYIDELVSIATTEGITPTRKELCDSFKTSKDTNWKLDATSNSRVAFRQSVSLVPSDHGTETNAQISHVAIKPGDSSRKGNRKQTGYPKFTFRDLLEQEVAEYDALQQKNEEQTNSRLNEQSSEAAKDKSEMHRLLDAICCSGGRDDEGEVVPAMVRRESSVSLTSVQEIEDSQTDRHWNEKQRHEARFQRIRNRIPTGNPSLMKKRSSELLGELDSFTDDTIGDSPSLFQTPGNVRSEPPSFKTSKRTFWSLKPKHKNKQNKASSLPPPI